MCCAAHLIIIFPTQHLTYDWSPCKQNYSVSGLFFFKMPTVYVPAIKELGVSVNVSHQNKTLPC